MLFSCKKSANSDIASPTAAIDHSKTQAVSFNLSGFTGGSEPLSSHSRTVNAMGVTALKDQVKYLYYFAYAVDVNTAITLQKKIVQKSTDPGFGTIKDVLPSGKYTIYFFGGQAEGDAKLVNKNTGAGPLEPIFYYKDSTVNESFWKKLDITVNAPKDTSVVLTRAVSKVTVKLTDAIPADAATIKMLITDFPVGFDLNLGNGEPRGRYSDEYYPTKTFTYNLKSTDKGKSNYTFNEFVWPFAFADITIESYNSAGTLIASKKLPKNFNDVLIEVKRNTNYIFTGKLYQNADTFTITADTTWNVPITKPFGIN